MFRLKTRPAAASILLLGALALGACDRKPKQEPNTIPPVAQDNTVPGGETTTVAGRTGSQSSGTLGSSTVIGAPPKGQAGLALAH
jgi:hypothetical protein